MIPNRSTEQLGAARATALRAIATVVAKHLRDEHTTRKLRHGDPDAPLIIHVDGPGKSSFLDALSEQLDGQWTTIRFDAWKYQRVAPPWWWLIRELDRQLRERFRRQSAWLWLWKRAVDIALRVWRFLRDAVWALPGLAILWLLVAKSDMGALDDWARAAIGAVSGLSALIAFLTSLANALRRHLLSQSPRGAQAVLSRTDPMADLVRRYAFLVRTAGTPVLFAIDNLDRCKADYIVEMLEGIQTLLHMPPSRKPAPLVAYVVAGEQSWLCDSYLQVYDKYADALREPGRPFGQAFMDKIFDVSLRLPTVPSNATLSQLPAKNRFRKCDSEQEVRRLLHKLERHAKHGAPDYALRVQAVKRLGELELESGHRQCHDTATVLERLRVAADLGKVVDTRLDTAYCVQRTTLLLGGHAFDTRRDAIERLGIWTMLSLRWPLLAAHLREHPADLDQLRAGQPPGDLPDPELAPVFSHSDARRLAAGPLTAADVRAYANPLGIPVPASSNGAGPVCAGKHAALVTSGTS